MASRVVEYDRLSDYVSSQESAEFRPTGVFEEGIRLFLDELSRNSMTSTVGLRLLQTELLRVMTQRSRFERRRRYLTPASIPDKSLVIAGSPRARSTLLHNQFADSGGFQWLPLWVMLEPFGDATEHDRDARYRRCAEQLMLTSALSPKLVQLHPMRTDRPEECMVLQQMTGVSDRFSLYVRSPEYRQWCGQPENSDVAYAEYVEMLALLARPGKPFVLKSPSHSRYVRSLERVLGDSCEVIWLERNSDEVDRSFLRLVSAIRKVFSPDDDGSDWRGAWTQLEPPAEATVVDYSEVEEFGAQYCGRHGLKWVPSEEYWEWLRPSHCFG